MNIQDRLPKKLCYSCYNCLLCFHKFKQTALDVDVQLREQLAEVIGNYGANKTILIKIKVENGTQSQDENDSLDNCNGYDTAVKQEMNENYRTTIYSDISDASQLEEYPEMLITELMCDICDKKFKSQAKLDRHILNHTHKFVCNICSQRFRHNFEYAEHFVNHSQNSKTKNYMAELNHNIDQRLQCEDCSATFKSIKSLSAHKRKHTSKDRVLSCSICDKIFKKISHLKRHELCHENNRPFKCSQCPKSFSMEATLAEHVNKHNGIKPHCCPICTKSFSHRSTLTNHMKIHTREKPYLCPTCGKRFDSSTNLNQHMKRHIGLKLFACNLCPRKFVSKGKLIKVICNLKHDLDILIRYTT